MNMTQIVRKMITHTLLLVSSSWNPVNSSHGQNVTDKGNRTIRRQTNSRSVKLPKCLI